MTVPNIVYGRGFRGLLTYLLEGGRGRVISGLGGMLGMTVDDLAREFGMYRSLRPRVKSPVWHCSLSFAPGENPGDLIPEVIARFVAGMGLSDHPYVPVLHTDKECLHVHLVVSRIGFHGQWYNATGDYQRSQIVCGRIERDLGLVQVPRLGLQATIEQKHPPIPLPLLPAPGEVEVPPLPPLPSVSKAGVLARLKGLVERALDGPHPLTDRDLILRLRGLGIGVALIQSGERISGANLELPGHRPVKMSDVHRTLSWTALQKRGVVVPSGLSSRDLMALASREVPHGAPSTPSEALPGLPDLPGLPPPGVPLPWPRLPDGRWSWAREFEGDQPGSPNTPSVGPVVGSSLLSPPGRLGPRLPRPGALGPRPEVPRPPGPGGSAIPVSGHLPLPRLAPGIQRILSDVHQLVHRAGPLVGNGPRPGLDLPMRHPILGRSGRDRTGLALPPPRVGSSPAGDLVRTPLPRLRALPGVDGFPIRGLPPHQRPGEGVRLGGDPGRRGLPWRPAGVEAPGPLTPRPPEMLPPGLAALIDALPRAARVTPGHLDGPADMPEVPPVPALPRHPRPGEWRKGRR